MVFGPPIFRERDVPNFGHAFSNRIHIRTCSRFWLSSVQLSPRVADEKKIESQ